MELNLENLRMEAMEVEVSKVQSSKGRGLLGISIVKNRNGNRVSFTENLYTELNSPGKVQFMVIPKRGLLLIGENLSNKISYNVSEKRPIVYSEPLVRSLAETFNLDYSNRTSISFSCVKVDTTGESPIAIIQIVDMERKAEANV